MTDQDRNQVIQLQREGLGYKRIAAKLNIPVNSVKTFCRRHPMVKDAATSKSTTCLQCGAVLIQTPHRKTKKFCSDKCRMTWWNAHQNQVNRSAYYQHTCPVCGKQFESYGQKNRVYCSRDCSAIGRSKGGRA